LKNLVRALVFGFVFSLSFATVAGAADPAPAAAKASHKVGDKVYICGCGKACGCNTLQAGAGKCHCGKDLVEATVTKVAANEVTVKTAAGEQVIKLKN
jgi:hypothetical protein